ncbi:MAG TPA: AmmeMemoRadiSam system radical SAM enzyme, partial [Bacteroidota bacterium]|nr:AmmeMemoRadiSam system radical SAM enzyme [Bacteroidota bacterium]
MCDAISSRTLSKRDFLRCLGFGVCGAALGSLDWCIAIPSSRARATIRNEGNEPDKWSKEALYWEQRDAGIQCLKCPNGCILGPGETGICRNRVNAKGKLYSIAYGNPCAVHTDPVEKKPLFHFLPSTRAFSIAAAGCSLRCLNCQNFQISQVSPHETQNYDLMPEAVVNQCIANGCQSIAYTYSEPTSFYEYTLDTAILARKRKVKNILKSNGYLNELPMRNLARHLDAANIDLKTFDAGAYKRLSQGSLEPILRALSILHEEGVWLEITNLVIPGWTDDPDTIARMCEWLCSNGLSEAPLHFTRFIPL